MELLLVSVLKLLPLLLQKLAGKKVETVTAEVGVARIDTVADALQFVDFSTIAFIVSDVLRDSNVATDICSCCCCICIAYSADAVVFIVLSLPLLLRNPNIEAAAAELLLLQGAVLLQLTTSVVADTEVVVFMEQFSDNDRLLLMFL